VKVQGGKKEIGEVVGGLFSGRFGGKTSPTPVMGRKTIGPTRDLEMGKGDEPQTGVQNFRGS